MFQPSCAFRCGDSTSGPIRASSTQLEEHCVDTNPERRTQHQADENPSSGTTLVVMVGVESRRRHARQGCDITAPKWNLRVSGSIRRHRAGCHAQSDATDAPDASVFIRSCLRTAIRSRIGSAPDEGPRSVQIAICEQPDFTDTHGAIRSVGTQLNRCEYWPRIAGRWASCHCTIAMTFKCLDCNLPIEGDPWWYDPLAHDMNAALPATAHRCRLATPRSTNACFSTISQGVLGEATGS